MVSRGRHTQGGDPIGTGCHARRTASPGREASHEKPDVDLGPARLAGVGLRAGRSHHRKRQEIRDRREQLDEEWAESPTLVAKAVGGALLREGSSTSAIEGDYISYDDLRDAATGVDPAEDADPRAAGVVGMLEACRAAPTLDRGTQLIEKILTHLAARETRGINHPRAPPLHAPQAQPRTPHLRQLS